MVVKDSRKSEGDEHNGSRTYDEEASGPTGVLAASHAKELWHQESRGS
jgi:hypothetical protein